MEQFFSTIQITTSGKGFTDITEQINKFIFNNNLYSGVLIINIMHTSCSLIVNENADSKVLHDLEKYFESIVPYNSYCDLTINRKENYYAHSQEGEDDMPAHIKTALTNTSLSFSVKNEKLAIGTWQAIYLWEHRYDKKERFLEIHAIGERKK